MQGESFLLETWLGNLPALKEAYELKEEFYWIWDTPDSDEGRLRYSQWRHRCMSSNSKDAYYHQRVTFSHIATG
jgi:hypothetical protein